MCVLPVEVNGVGSGVGKQRHSGQSTIDVCARPPNDWDDATQDRFGAVGSHETPVDSCFLSAVAHYRRVGSTTNEKFDRIDQHRLARASFARQRGETGAKHQFETFDDAEVLDVEFRQHKAQYRNQVSQSCGPRRTFVR